MKQLIMFFLMCACISPTHAQLLKKLKDKVTKTVENATGNSSKSSTEAAPANADGKDPVANKNSDDDISSHPDNYKMAYSSPVNFRIMYDESRLNIRRNKSDYRLILKQSPNNKIQFVIIDNGKVTATVDSLSEHDIIGGVHGSFDGLNGGYNSITEKYVVAETSSIKVEGQDSKTITAPKQIDGDQTILAFEMMKSTEDYKKLSSEEKKELEETMKQIPQAAKAFNSSDMAGKALSIPGVKGGTYTTANGSYSIIINGKNYGKFSGKPILMISADEANVYIVGSDDKGKTDFISNDKRITLASNGPSNMGHSGNIIISPDGQKAVFIEMKTLTEKEFDDRNKSVENGGNFTIPYLVTKSDGTSFEIVRPAGDDKYRLTNSGALVYVDKNTREVFSNGKAIAKFTGNADGGTIADGLIVGDDPSKICYYMDDGSLIYLDGTQKRLGILFPQIITDNGKTYLTWFKKVKNDIYIGKFEF